MRETSAHRRTSPLLLLPLCLVLAALAACGSAASERSSEPAVASFDGLPIAEIGTRWATDQAQSLQTLVASTDWHFTAEVISLDHQEAIDLVPDVPGETPAPYHPDKPIPANDGPPPFPVSYWEARVIEVFSGDLSPGDTVLIRQMGGVHEQSTGEIIRVLLADEAASPVEDECAFALPTIEGAFRPNEPLSAFDGETFNGTWEVRISDHDGGFTGSVVGATFFWEE